MQWTGRTSDAGRSDGATVATLATTPGRVPTNQTRRRRDGRERGQRRAHDGTHRGKKGRAPRPKGTSKRAFGYAGNRQTRGIPGARSERLVSPLPSEQP